MSNTSIENKINVESAFESHIFVSEGFYSYGERKGEPYRFEETGWYEWSEVASSDESVEVPGIGTVRGVQAETGGEGSAEHIFMVFEVTDADGCVKFYQKTGYYASFDGSNWDGDFSEVEPSEKTITVYTPVK